MTTATLPSLTVTQLTPLTFRVEAPSSHEIASVAVDDLGDALITLVEDNDEALD